MGLSHKGIGLCWKCSFEEMGVDCAISESISVQCVWCQGCCSVCGVRGVSVCSVRGVSVCNVRGVCMMSGVSQCV